MFTLVFLLCGRPLGFFYHYFCYVVTMARMNRPAPVEITYKNMRFLITHNPTNATLNKFTEVSHGAACYSRVLFSHMSRELVFF